MKNGLLIIFLLLCSCTPSTCALSRLDYDCIVLGTPIGDVMATAGEPYSVHCLSQGGQEYEYIERLSIDRELIYENHYYLKVVNGQVVSKRIYQENRPAYDLMYQADPNYPNYPPYQ
jgi:hypothetical protein